MVSLHCINLELLMTEMGHNPNCRPTGLCRLWPAADIAVEMLTAGLSRTGRESEGFAQRALWNIDSTAHRPHSGLMLAARITFAHFSVSSATNFPNSAGVIGMGSPASSARRACNFGSANY